MFKLEFWWSGDKFLRLVVLISVLIGDGVRVGERGRKVVGDEGEKKKRCEGGEYSSDIMGILQLGGI